MNLRGYVGPADFFEHRCQSLMLAVRCDEIRQDRCIGGSGRQRSSMTKYLCVCISDLERSVSGVGTQRHRLERQSTYTWNERRGRRATVLQYRGPLKSGRGRLHTSFPRMIYTMKTDGHHLVRLLDVLTYATSPDKCIRDEWEWDMFAKMCDDESGRTRIMAWWQER